MAHFHVIAGASETLEFPIVRRIGPADLTAARVLGLHRWPIFLADEGCQGDWLWDFGASGAGVKITSRTG